ncbi:asparagine synthase-related protein [Paenibacillus sp. GYB003]|uniref:asparagine synthase-related protein n=1 Tax=Paenibacillus sp. GYB003 TaxID=2994392 RepID=UPI002F966AE2
MSFLVAQTQENLSNPGVHSKLKFSDDPSAISIQEGNVFIFATYPWSVQINETDGRIEHSCVTTRSVSIFGSWEGSTAAISITDAGNLRIYLEERGLAPVGIYYASVEGSIVASDNLDWVKQVVNRTQKLTINWRYISTYSLMGNPYVHGTPYNEIQRLLSGHAVVFNGYEWEKQRRWYFPQLSNQVQDLDSLESRIYGNLTSFADRLWKEESAVGLLLSGGIDSTSLLNMLIESAKKIHDKKEILCVSWCYPGKFGDEKALIEHTTNHYKVESIIMNDCDLFNINEVVDVIRVDTDFPLF